jgi:hypothetical protein
MRVLAILLFGLACSRSSAPAPRAQATPDARAPGGGSQAGAQPRSAPKRSREELVKQALARVPAVRAEVSRLRKLPSKEVPAAYQTQADFQRFLEREMAVELPPAKASALSRGMFHLGLLREKIDLGPALLDAFKTQAGAYYDPTSKKFFIVLVPDDPTLLDVLSAHELTHAVQDQHFDLLPFLGGRGNSKGLSEDTINARRFVMEGEATLVMMAFMLSRSGGDVLQPDRLAQLRQTIQMLARMDTAQLSQMTKAQAAAFVDLGDDFKRAMEAMDKIPPYVLVPLYDAYFKGALTVLEAYAAAGWDGVARLYREPPDSTEQVLHPVEKLVKARDVPVIFGRPPTPKALAGWQPLYSDVLGELLWRVYFTNWGRRDANEVAAGWDGDRWAAWTQGDKTFAAVATAWDSPEEAAQFAKAYEETLATRGVKGMVKQVRERVLIVLGCEVAPCEAVMAELERLKPR